MTETMDMQAYKRAQLLERIVFDAGFVTVYEWDERAMTFRENVVKAVTEAFAAGERSGREQVAELLGDVYNFTKGFSGHRIDKLNKRIVRALPGKENGK
jgi:hypothetical protein